MTKTADWYIHTCSTHKKNSDASRIAVYILAQKNILSFSAGDLGGMVIAVAGVYFFGGSVS